MKVLALVTDAFGGSGGIAQYNRDLVKALAGCPGANRIVIVPRLGSAEGASLPPGVCQLKAHANRVGYSLAALRAAATRGPFDFVFCGHLYLLPLAALIALLLRTPLWLQLYGWEAWEKLGRSKRWAVERTDLITSISRYTRARFLSVAAIDPARIRVLPPTIEDRFSPGAKPAHLLDRYGLRGKRVLLTVGRMDPAERCKGQDKVIEALPEILRTLPNVVYLIAGSGADRTRLETLARTVGVEKHVVFAGGVPPDELPQLYRLADLFVMPSTQEGFGIVFLEAAASGVRPVGGNADGSADALADGTVGTAIDPANAETLAAAIRQGLADGGVDPSVVGRFRFPNFSRCIRELIECHLMRAASGTV
jgi:phosphatidyl-myo-inositol dimannoside synthase